MPTYQYACTECDHAFEAVQSFSDDSLTVCPSCEGRLRKVFNAVGVVFKGSGFYRNDSRADANAKAGSNGSSGESSKGESAESSKGGSAESSKGGSAESSKGDSSAHTSEPSDSSGGSDSSSSKPKKADSTSAA